MPTYTPAGDDYLAQRQLRRHARVPHLWAMGVGAVISGDFFGWNFGLASGGFGCSALRRSFLRSSMAGPGIQGRLLG